VAVALKQAIERMTPFLAAAARGFVAARGWVPFGHARLDDHARERFGRSGRWVRDLAALGGALDRLPALEAALVGRDGRAPVGQVAALLIGRVASPPSVAVWIELARRLPIRDFKVAVRDARGAGSSLPLPRGSTGLPSTASNDEGSGGDCTVDSNEERTGCERSAESHEHRAGCTASADGEATVGRAADAPPIETEERVLVRLFVPEPIRVAFRETLALHRSVIGGEGSVASFVDALVGEALAGAHPFDPDDAVEMPPRSDAAEVERRLHHRADGWIRLDEDARCQEGPALDVLARVRRIAARAGQGGPAELDGQIQELVALEEQLKSQLGRLLMIMGRERGWSKLCFAGLEHYAEQRLGLSATTARDRARLARGLLRLPFVREAYEGGRIKYEAALMIIRAVGGGPVDPDVERAWVAHAGCATIRRLRDEARALARRRVAEPRRSACRPMGDAEWYASLRQEPGAIGERVRSLGRRTLRRSAADVFLSLRLPGDLAGRFLAAIEGTREALTAAAAAAGTGPDQGHAAGSDGARPNEPEPVAWRVARLLFSRSRRVPEWVALLALLEDFVATWDDPAGMPRRRSDEIYARDGWRCTAPGCTSRRNLEDHHVVYLSRGGSLRASSNQVSLCRFHHKLGEHGTLASCTGRAPLDLLWRLGRPEIGSWYRNDRRLDVVGGRPVRGGSHRAA
jgi:hypothetical protein